MGGRKEEGRRGREKQGDFFNWLDSIHITTLILGPTMAASLN